MNLPSFAMQFTSTTPLPARRLADHPVLRPDRGFVVATGIECSAPRVADGIRQDELIKTGHWERYAEDFDLVEQLGIPVLRFGVPFHVVAADPQRNDWSWTDAALAELQRHDVEPVVDLLHFGLPDDLAGVSDPRLVERFLPYLAEFVERHPEIRCYTPVNEPLITAYYSARKGWWNERATDDATFVRAIDNLVTCAVRGMEIIRARRPDAVFLQSDVCWSFEADGPEAAELTAFMNDMRFLAFELTYGRRPNERMVRWLAVNGLDEDRLAWFAEHGSTEGCILGHDFYEGNEIVLAADGTEKPAPPRGYAAVAREYHERLPIPFMLAETNNRDERAVGWLEELWSECELLRADDLPIRGFCWYSLTDQVDWNTALRENAGHIDTFGLVDLDRRIRPVGAAIASLTGATGATGATAGATAADAMRERAPLVAASSSPAA